MRCDQGGVYACRTGELQRLPANCPMQENDTIYQEARAEYQKPEIKNCFERRSNRGCRLRRLDTVGRNHGVFTL
ncbi:hypothetical protein E308F_00170 [Moorella sp. E308F]|jgi:hypothetical protein|nr:hypothetical protein E308F_00170 [Moorella sp. E308F]GEA18858.1 hypothetical protein E306M_19950 [Moorella sp. E306M]